MSTMNYQDFVTWLTAFRDFNGFTLVQWEILTTEFQNVIDRRRECGNGHMVVPDEETRIPEESGAMMDEVRFAKCIYQRRARVSYIHR